MIDWKVVDEKNGVIAKQQAELNDYHRQLEDKTRLVKMTGKANSQMATEINELKAMVNDLREYIGTGEQHKASASDMLAVTPAQCLASVKAGAEKKGYWQGFETGSVFPSGNILQMYNGWLDLKATNEAYANKIRGEHE